jgi:hypothetical protein
MDPLSILSAVLPRTYTTYKALIAVINSWQEADVHLKMLVIRFEVAYSEALSNLEQLANVPDRPDASVIAREKEIHIRQDCKDILEVHLRNMESRMVGLINQRERREMNAAEKAVWILQRKDALTKAADELEEWNGRAAGVCNIKIKHLYHPHQINSVLPPSLPIKALAEMALARGEATAFLSESIVHSIWIDPSLLLFDDNDVPQSRSQDSSSWSRLLSRLRIRKSEPLKLKFLLRRFGALNRDGLQQVMVEFRPYSSGVGGSNRGERERTRNQALQLGWMLHSATTTSTSSQELPLVPFKGVSELRESDPPCFLLVYDGDNLETLFSVIKSYAHDHQPAPHKISRLRLAVALAKAIFTLHRTGYIHGGLTTDNIFLRPDGQVDNMQPVIAGFEIARMKDGHTNKLDVTDKDHILYLHPGRLPGGTAKDSNYPPYDVCTLGVVLLEIGLWMPLRYMKGMSVVSDAERRLKVYKATRKLSVAMGQEYQKAVEYCLSGYYVAGTTAPIGGVASEVRSLCFDTPNATEVIAMLEPLLHYNES